MSQATADTHHAIPSASSARVRHTATGGTPQHPMTDQPPELRTGSHNTPQQEPPLPETEEQVLVMSQNIGEGESLDWATKQR